MVGGRGRGLGVRWGGLGFRRAGGALDEVDVLASGGAGEEHALQRGGTQDASVQVGEDGGEVGSAEARGDGVEVRGGGAVADGVDEVAAIAEQDASGVEDDCDVVGEGGGGVLLWGIGRGGGRCSGGGGLHTGSVSTKNVRGEARNLFRGQVVAMLGNGDSQLRTS